MSIKQLLLYILIVAICTAQDHTMEDATVPMYCQPDTFTCPDGTLVVRDPFNNCEFLECPIDTSQATESGGSESPCPTDLFNCPDGSTVGRDITNNCEYLPCPGEENNETSVETGTETDANETSVDTGVETDTNETSVDTGEQTDTEESTHECPSGNCPSVSEGGEDNENITSGENAGLCPSEAQLCEGGYYVGRDVDNNCEFFTCESNETSNCIFGTFRFGGYCACWSGASGKNCTMGSALPGTSKDIYPSVVSNPWSSEVRDIADMYYKLDFELMKGRAFLRNFTNHPSCAEGSWEKVYDLETGGVPVIDSFRLENTSLYIVVSHPLVDGRADGSLFLNNDEIDELSEDCYYPRSDYIEKTVDGCRDTWTFNLPWDSAKACGWKIVSEESHFVYRGQVIVHSMEWLSIKQWRIIRSVLRLKIRFQKFIRVDCETTLLNEKIKSAAITRQIVAIQLGQPALVELTTVLNFPYKFLNGSLVKFPIEKITNFTFSFKDCDGSENSDCVQNWRTLLYLEEDACTLDGDYAMNFSLGCSDSINQNDCPIEETTVEYKLRSEDFCAETSVDVGIYGNIMCFTDENFSSHSEMFIVGTKAYFLISVNSDINPRNNATGELDTSTYDEATAIIKIDSLFLFCVTVRMEEEIIRLWDNGSACPEDLDTGIALVENGDLKKNQIAFSFTFSRLLLTVLKKNAQLKVTVGAEVEIKYSDDSSTQKRFTLQSGNSDRSTFDTAQNVDDPDSSAVTFFAYMILLIVAMLF